MSGVADFVADADLADIIVATADADGRTVVFVVDTTAAGIRIEPVPMMGGHPAFAVRFDDVAVDDAATVDDSATAPDGQRRSGA